jgi:hypothetical protein
MLELLILISGCILLWRFSKSTKAVSEGAETKAQVWAEQVISNAVLERQETYKLFVEATTDEEGNRKHIISHDSFMSELRGK